MIEHGTTDPKPDGERTERGDPTDLSPVRSMIREARDEKGVLIEVLRRIQDVYQYVPGNAVDLLCEETGASPVDVFGILTFYDRFRLTPPGEHTITVCQGTACHVMGSERILEYLSERLGVKPGGTTPDGLISLESVACVGCCGMGPVVIIDGEIRGRRTVKASEGMIEGIRGEKV